MGYFLLSWSLLFCGVSLLGYPREMPYFKKKRLEAIKGGDLPTDDAEIGKGWRDMIRATLQLFKNITYICSTLGLTVRTMYGVAIGSFFAKILVLKFGGSSYVVGIITGCVMVPGMFLGILGGSFIMKKVKLRDSAKTACKISFALGIVTCFGSITWIIPGCGDTVLAGATVPYHGSTNLGSVTGQCNMDCGCSRSSYLPTCGSDGITYFSPCHAGCTSRSGRATFANCTCMPITSQQTKNISKPIHIDKIVSLNKNRVFNQTTSPKGNSSVKSTYEKKDNVSQFHQTSFRTATFGRCDRGCKNVWIFLVLSCVLILVVFITATPQKMIILRCVPDNQRSYALGLQFLCMRSLSFIPGPVIFGEIIDGECTLWSKNACGKRGNCLEYKVDSLSISILIFGCVTAIIGTLMYALAWYFYVPAPTANEDDAEKSPGEKNVLITDDPPVKKTEEDNVSLHSVGKLVA